MNDGSWGRLFVDTLFITGPLVCYAFFLYGRRYERRHPDERTRHV